MSRRALRVGLLCVTGVAAFAQQAVPKSTSSIPKPSLATPLARSPSANPVPAVMPSTPSMPPPRTTPPKMASFGALSLLPPLATLVASIALRQTMLAMLFGIWTGAMLLNGGNPVIALLRSFDFYTVRALADIDHAGVVLFTMVLGGTIGLVQKGGGALGLAELVKGFFTSRRRGALATMMLGCTCFFDDYSSILIVGNSLRPLIQTVRISLAKFAFIAHVMGVVLASLAPLSSWVGIQIGYIAGAYEQLGAAALGGNADPFIGFLSTLRFRFFPLCLLMFLGISTVTGRDFGPMLEAEREAEQGSASELAVVDSEPQPEADGPLDPDPETPLRAVNALLPFGSVLAASFAGMVLQGLGVIKAMAPATRPAATLVNALRYADSVAALIWGSATGCMVAMGLVLSQRILSLPSAMTAWVEGAKEVLEPTFVLVLAWALGAVIADVGTADFLAGALQAGLPAWSLPALISLLCYAISFACGSSIGTMGIVFPLVGPLAMKMGGGSINFLHLCFGSILGGSLFGNICSPISDTTVLTVLATRCSLTKHVGTVIGYTALVGAISLIFGDLAVGLGLYGPTVAFGLMAAVMLGVQTVFGRRVDQPDGAPKPTLKKAKA